MILDRIVKQVKLHVAEQQAACPLEELQRALTPASQPDTFKQAELLSSPENPSPTLPKGEEVPPLLRRGAGGEVLEHNSLSFKQALRRPGMRVIAEIKKASPSAGVICPNFVPPTIASEYAEAGAAAISVLTEVDFFQGSLDILRNVRETVALPLLRKDFIIAPYQIYQARVYGADAILLIASILSERELADFQTLAESLGMNALVEVHNKAELEKVLRVGAAIIGINNRDLRTFTLDLRTTLELRECIPASSVIVSESGIKNRQDVEQLKAAGIDAVLVGETLMRAPDKLEIFRSLGV